MCPLMCPSSATILLLSSDVDGTSTESKTSNSIFIFDGNDHLLLLLQLRFMPAVHGSDNGGSGRDWRMALHVCNRFALLHIKFDGNPTETILLMQYD